MIFEAACIESRSSPSTNTEVIISHVCHSWRSISLSCPQLWSTFKHDGWTLEKPIQQSQVNAYIKRSQNQLLDFAFEVDDSMGLFTVAQNDIVPNISRFRRLALCISSQAEFVVALLELFEFLHMDNLEIFELHLREDADWPSEIEEVEAFFFKGEAPRLKAIRTISRFLWLFHAAKALEHSTDITDFQLDAIPPFLTGWNDFSSFFVNASTLTTLSLSGHIFRARSPNDVQTVYFPSLKYFRCRDDAVAQSISRFLRAPLLEQLILQNLDIGSWAKTSGRAAPPIDVFPRIKVVAFMNCNIYNSKNSPLSALAQATCSATHIMVSHDNVLQLPAKGGIIKYLVRHGRKPVLWENMEVLSSFDQFMSKERYSCYLDMMKYRVENVLNGKVGKLRILERHAKQHRGSVANEGIVEAVRYGEDVLPWPYKDLFHRSAEDFFLLG